MRAVGQGVPPRTTSTDRREVPLLLRSGGMAGHDANQGVNKRAAAGDTYLKPRHVRRRPHL